MKISFRVQAPRSPIILPPGFDEEAYERHAIIRPRTEIVRTPAIIPPRYTDWDYNKHAPRRAPFDAPLIEKQAAIDAVFVGKGHGASPATTSSGTTSVSGSTFVFAASFDPGSTQSTPTDSKGNTYTIMGTVQAEPVTGGKLVFYKSQPGDAGYVGGGASHTASMVMTGTPAAATFLIEITGGTTSPLDTATLSQGTDTSSPFTITSPALTQANEVVIVLIGANNGATATNTYSSSNFTILAQEADASLYWTSAIAKLVVSSTLAVTPSFTCLQGSQGALKLASFMDAGGGGGGAKAVNNLLWM